MSKKNNYALKIFLAIVAFIGIAFVFMFVRQTDQDEEEIAQRSLSSLVSGLKRDEIANVALQYDDKDCLTATVTYKDPTRKKTVTNLPKNDNHFVQELKASKIDFEIVYPVRIPMIIQQIISIIQSLFAPILMFLFIIFFFSNRGSMAGGMFSKQFRQSDPDNTTTLKDVRGIDVIKDNLMDLVKFLKHPEEFSAVKATLPKGVLLSGEPGTGKTLIARAIANEAGVPFFHCSGSEFVEMYVGLGAMRVRSLFDQARKVKGGKCVIFIDEIDAIGQKRGRINGHQESENTLNELLIQMDGFKQNLGILVIGATNKVDSLDKALTRPGRFDRKIKVPIPDYKGRAEIFWLKLDQINTDPEGFDIGQLISMCAGGTGAFISSIVNYAAIIAVNKKRKYVTREDLYDAFYNEIIGLPTGMVMDQENKVNTAYHEAGHAIASLLTRDPKNPSSNCDKILKITILPRGDALGMVVSAPDKEPISISYAKMRNLICMSLAGRIAEAIKFGEKNITSGATNDAMKASSIAKNMVTYYGMGDLGMLTYDSTTEHVPQEIQNKIGANAQRILEEEYKRCEKILRDNWNQYMEPLAQKLLEVETLSLTEVLELLNLPSYDIEENAEVQLENPKVDVEKLKFYKKSADENKNQEANMDLSDSETTDSSSSEKSEKNEDSDEDFEL